MDSKIIGSHTLQNRPTLGILLMIGALALYTFCDALVKVLLGSHGYSVQQVVFLRSGLRTLPLVVATFFQGGPMHVLHVRQLRLSLIRLIVSLAYTFIFIYSFSITSLTNVYTLSYTSPLFMTLLGAVLLNERVSAKRWFALSLGMIGVLVAIRPSPSTFEWASIIVLVGTFLGALNKILMRRLAATEHTLAIAIYPNLAMVAIIFPFLLNHWQPMPWSHWTIFAVIGTLTSIGQYSIAQALRYAQVSVLAPIDYSTLFWTVIIDCIWWQPPGRFMLAGAALIILSNLYILHLSSTTEETSSSKFKLSNKTK